MLLTSIASYWKLLSQRDTGIIQIEGKNQTKPKQNFLKLNRISSGHKISKHHQESKVNSLCFLFPNSTEGMLLVQTFPLKQKIKPHFYLTNSFAILALNISKWEALPQNSSQKPIFFNTRSLFMSLVVPLSMPAWLKSALGCPLQGTLPEI